MNKSLLLVGTSLVLSSLAVNNAICDVPPRPEDLSFAPLEFNPPKASEFRRELPGGIPVYMAPSNEFPLISLSLTFQGGEYLVDEEDIGLANALGTMLRTGGTVTSSPAQVDEDLDFLATIASTNVGRATTSASMNCLASNFDESLMLFMEMLQSPAYDADRLELWRADTIEGMKQRNDDADSIQRREFRDLMAPDHFSAREPTLASVQGITPEKLDALRQRIIHPGNMIVAVSGDFDPDVMLKKLSAAFEGWEKGDAVPRPPAPQGERPPGVYRIEKDIPQGKVLIGTRTIKRDDPDYFAFLLMNEVLGGGAFSSRITSRVRSDEGLAYSAGSAFQPAVWYPGVFVAFFQSKNSTVALANKIVFEEIARIRDEPVSAEELETAKQSFIETFPQQFSSKDATLGIFVDDEWTERPDGFWETYRDRIAAIQPEDLQRVAEKYLHPDEMRVLIVGKWDEIYPGDEAGRATMNDIFNGQSTELPLRDPLTMEPMNP